MGRQEPVVQDDSDREPFERFHAICMLAHKRPELRAYDRVLSAAVDIFDLDCEVQNGGFAQALLNEGPHIVIRASEAYRSLSFEQHAGLCDEVVRLAELKHAKSIVELWDNSLAMPAVSGWLCGLPFRDQDKAYYELVPGFIGDLMHPVVTRAGLYDKYPQYMSEM